MTHDLRKPGWRVWKGTGRCGIVDLFPWIFLYILSGSGVRILQHDRCRLPGDGGKRNPELPPGRCISDRTQPPLREQGFTGDELSVYGALCGISTLHFYLFFPITAITNSWVLHRIAVGDCQRFRSSFTRSREPFRRTGNDDVDLGSR